VVGNSTADYGGCRGTAYLRMDLLMKARILSQALSIEPIRALSGTEADLGTPTYLRLKAQLVGVKKANDKCRFVYLMGRLADGRGRLPRA